MRVVGAADLGPELGTLDVPADAPIAARKHFWVGHGNWLYLTPAKARADLVAMRRPLESRCRKAARHDSPAPGCNCGVWASTTERFWGSGEIAVMVQGWGQTIEHVGGYRFHRARLVAVVDERRYSPTDDSINPAAVAAHYGLEVWPGGGGSGVPPAV